MGRSSETGNESRGGFESPFSSAASASAICRLRISLSLIVARFLLFQSIIDGMISSSSFTCSTNSSLDDVEAKFKKGEEISCQRNIKKKRRKNLHEGSNSSKAFTIPGSISSKALTVPGSIDLRFLLPVSARTCGLSMEKSVSGNLFPSRLH